MAASRGRNQRKSAGMHAGGADEFELEGFIIFAGFTPTQRDEAGRSYANNAGTPDHYFSFAPLFSNDDSFDTLRRGKSFECFNLRSFRG